MGIIHALVTRVQNRGINGSPRTPEYHYKKGGRIAKRGRELENGRTIDKILSMRENSKKISKIISRYPRKSHYSTYSDSKRTKLCKLKG